MPQLGADGDIEALREELKLVSDALRDLYDASVPLTGERPLSVEQWSRWYGAMHEAHDWRSGDIHSWPEWAGPEPA